MNLRSLRYRLINTRLYILMFLIGNDFLPNLPSIHLKHDGIDYILDIYDNLLCMREEYLISDNEINIGFLKALFIKFKLEEGRKLRSPSPYRRRFTRTLLEPLRTSN